MTSSSVAEQARRLAPRLALGAYLVVAAVLTLQPSASLAVGWLRSVHDMLAALGLPADLIALPRLEIACNAALAAPLSVLGLIAFPTTNWRDWTAGAFLAAVAIEGVQGVLLPGRSATYVDVVANTTGAAAGGLLFVGTWWWRTSAARGGKPPWRRVS